MAALMTLLVAACGNGAGAAQPGGGGSSSCVRTASQRAQAAEANIRLSLPSQPVSMSKNQGKAIWYIAPDLSIPFIQSIANGVKEAAQAAGMKAVIFDGRGNVDTFNQGVSSAVNQHANGIILQGINPSLVSGPLGQARAQGIPVIDSLNGDPDQPLSPGILAHVTVNYTEGGKLMADWILADSHCSAQAAIFTSNIYTIYQNMQSGFTEEFKSLCSSCKLVTVQNVAPDQVATGLPTITSTVLERFPAVRYLVPFYDAMVPNMIPSVKSAGGKAVIISHDGVLENLDLIREGNVQKADVSNPPNPAMGWAEVDELGRIMAGQSPVEEALPQQLFVKANLGTSNSDLFPGYASYQAQYRKLWGVG